MNNEQILFFILGLILAAVIIGTIVIGAIRKKDFNDQVSGKKPERKVKGEGRVSYDKPTKENSQISIDREILRTKSGQSLLGPK